MMFEKYDAYKDSGVEWLGAIPEEWSIKPGLVAFSENKRSNKGMVRNTVLSLSYGKIIIKPEEKLVGLVPESFETYQLVEPSDIIIRCTDLQNDQTSLRTGLAKDAGIITSAYLNLNVKQGFDSKYLHYYLHALDTTKVLYKLGSGLRQNLSFLDFKRLPVLDIALSEQKKISSFLDQKTSEIDQAIAIKEQQIALLNERKQIVIQKAVTQGLDPNVPMKDSGVEWIGQIPEHWETYFNRRLFRENSRPVKGDELPLSLSQKDGVIPSGEMKERSLSPSHRNNFKLCFPNDLVVNRFKGHLGVFFQSNYTGIVTFHYGVFEPAKNVYTKYFELLYHTEQYKTLYAGASNGMSIGLQNLSNLNFYRIKSIVPPLEEQKLICEYADKVENEHNNLIQKLESQIEKLKEYKTTLINDAVTGKIKVA
ncbi:restriction endonuclease subunit S [Acinetobacter bereziniae]|uniref:restriction endonuclease subunit S n=1 Tax=Acinetobacter bereziniae TaxID=106648 RepID=UPI0018DC900E|nr:restriction endonuclease subunit S [Acinetobacter bereziniae]MBI0395880.1 restriction endonuclease subunit S [Acinetobacter bereziniae]